MEPGDAKIPCPDQEHHDSRTCPVCQPLIHGHRPPKAHPVIVGKDGHELVVAIQLLPLNPRGDTLST